VCAFLQGKAHENPGTHETSQEIGPRGIFDRRFISFARRGRQAGQSVKAVDCLLKILVTEFIDIGRGESLERFRLRLANVVGKREILLKVLPGGLPGKR
jgi:hypothetical protein